jgi:hypothetical protein
MTEELPERTKPRTIESYLKAVRFFVGFVAATGMPYLP